MKFTGYGTSVDHYLFQDGDKILEIRPVQGFSSIFTPVEFFEGMTLPIQNSTDLLKQLRWVENKFSNAESELNDN